MTKKKLLVDFDNVICDDVFLTPINKFLHTNYKLSDIKDYLLDELVPSDKLEEFYDYLFSDDLYRDAKLIDGAKEALKKLNDKYDLYICSACIIVKRPNVSGLMFSYKFNFLIKNLGFLDPNKFVFTSSKDIVCGDILIDDYHSNLKSSQAKTKLLFDSYHNKHFLDSELKKEKIERVCGWRGVCDKLL